MYSFLIPFNLGVLTSESLQYKVANKRYKSDTYGYIYISLYYRKPIWTKIKPQLNISNVFLKRQNKNILILDKQEEYNPAMVDQ